jgi:hypothetical protein
VASLTELSSETARGNIHRPNTLAMAMWSNSQLARGRENRSSHRMRRSSIANSFSRDGPASWSLSQRAGRQIRRRPTTSCKATSIVTTSSTCVAPPVGSGSAGSATSGTNTSAKCAGRTAR